MNRDKLEEWKCVEELHYFRPTWKYAKANYSTKRKIFDKLVASVEHRGYEARIVFLVCPGVSDINTSKTRG
jgi:gentisate 1,2-dioxygenase